MVEMTFLEYINARIEDGEEFDAVIGDEDMPATFGFCDDNVITDYCKEKYGELLNSNIEIMKCPHSIDTVIVDYNSSEVGQMFSWAVAGYVSESEWDKLFTKVGNA
jgi:hypothetical protein